MESAGQPARPGRVVQALRKLVLGDWSPALRDPLDLWRLSFAGAAVAFLLALSYEYAVRLGGTFALLVVARQLRVPRLFDALFLLGMTLQAWGNALRFFENYGWWDDLVHFVIPFASVPVLYILHVRLGLAPDIAEETNPRQRFGLVLFAVLAGLSIGALYEVYEYVANRWLGADIEIGYADTISDLALDAAGAALGGVLLMLWAVEHWSTRRKPGA